MDIAQFLVNPKETTFRGLRIVYNADAFTPDFLRKAARAFRDGYLPVLNGLPDEEPKPEPPKNEKEKAVTTLQRIAERYEEQASELELRRDVYAVLLAGTDDYPVVMEWDLTRDGVPVAITEEEFRKLKPQIVTDLWDHLKNAADPKEQEIPPAQTSPTISETTKLRSSSPETPPDDAPVM